MSLTYINDTLFLSADDYIVGRELWAVTVDTTPPVITLLGDNPMDAPFGQPYVDPWATALDAVDGPLPVSATSNQISPATLEIVYSATDSAGNTGTATRTVNYGDNIPPVITVLGDNPFIIQYGETYVDPWATAVDAVDGPLPITASSTETSPGVYEVEYPATDSSGNTPTATRIVQAVP